MEFGGAVEALRRELAAYVGADGADGIPWNWMAVALARALGEHGSGMARAVALAELETQWHQIASGQVLQEETHRTVAPFFSRGAKPPHDAVFGLEIASMAQIPGTGIWLWRVTGAPDPPGACENGAARSGRRRHAETHTDAFVHQRYYPMIEAAEFEGFFARRRTLFATNLRMADRGGGCGQPLHTLLPATALAFELRLKGDPGLPLALHPHTDEQTLRDLFGVRYAGGRFCKCAKPLFNADQLWCRVEEIFRPGEGMKGGRLVPSQLVRCVVEHENPAVVVSVTLWGEDVALARLWRPDCYVGFLCPAMVSWTSKTEADVEYGDQTISFVAYPLRRVAEVCASQVSIERNELGLFDYQRFAHRIRLSQCRADMVNVTVLARVVAVSGSLPFAGDDGVVISRHAVRIDDGSAVRDVTLWGDLSHQAACLLPGQLVLWHGLDTSEENGEVILSGSGDENLRFFNISETAGLLASSTLRQYTLLAALPAAANRYARVCVVDIAPAGEGLCDARDRLAATALVHCVCRRPVARSDRPDCSGRLENPTDFYYFDCPLCGASNLGRGEAASAFSVSVTVDDGTAAVAAAATASAAMVILGISPEQFLALPSAAEQHRALVRPLGAEIVVSITTYGDALSSERGVRIEAVCAASAVGTLWAE
ncbi:hypothetical protein H4R18_001555 [Coemansia javaensis]|uniref:Uncharacterized protein n=1 Tax=Coemansia javaensis TaxID=2761396 RepID=A0A9W8LLE8_9FUNG|nr:hypothetical protein H4R18_001555 [Coemansia javaensis]